MAQEVWILVEWVDEKNIFPHYSVVNMASLIDDVNEIHAGKIVFVRNGRNSIGKAQILRISNVKRHIKEMKMMLERQDTKVKNVLSLCMKSIKDTKSMTMGLPEMSESGPSRRSQVLPRRRVFYSSDSETDDKENSEPHQSLSSERRIQKYKDLFTNHSIPEMPILSTRSLISSTPLPKPVIPEPVITIDQATQTDESDLQREEEIRVLVDTLYTQFQQLSSNLTLANEETLSSETSLDLDYIISEIEESVEEILTNNPPAHSSTSNGAREITTGCKVRRVSTQTTNVINKEKRLQMEKKDGKGSNTELVPIGKGNALVPAHILDAINWTSYTLATRQLLDAVFPRSVLATHSLTGKPSPAFANKPVKKRLNPDKVEDIITTISERSGVSTKLIRSCITVKCTDEAKLYRKRKLNLKLRKKKKVQNVSPSSNFSDDSCLNK